MAEPLMADRVYHLIECMADHDKATARIWADEILTSLVEDKTVRPSVPLNRAMITLLCHGVLQWRP